MRASKRAAILTVFLLLVGVAQAGGPRFVTGPPFFTAPIGQPIGWRQPLLLYSTDPAALSAFVDHQAADALIAAAAGVWNVPVAGITLARGAPLAEHVSSANTFLDPSGLVFPADVASSNAAGIPLAVLYDTDGSLTDLLLGSGASEPSGCRQNAVTESVDSFDPAGFILHAILIVNGRCTGAAPELQLELQYQLMRAFGRVLGLAWSQTNDNVFTGSPAPTRLQALNWPILHPLDIICGLYAYQCLPSPFTLRPDDISSLVAVYPASQSLAHALALTGHIAFPTGEGMAGVNVLVRRESSTASTFDSWYEASGVTGARFRSSATSPFLPGQTSAQASFGSGNAFHQGLYNIAWVPIDGQQNWQNLTLSTEPVNPLYLGAHSLGPYAPGSVTPSGSPVSQTSYIVGGGSTDTFDFTIADAAPTCGNGQDGTASAPIPVPSTGWWNGLICAYGHVSFLSAAVRPGRTFTVEVTALDEQGLPSSNKLMPVIGLFAPGDQPGDLPSLGVTPAAFQSRTIGTSTLSAATGQLSTMRLGIADQRNDGRPDFHFQARLFYADTVVPAQLPLTGGPLILSGLGFRAGNAVTINGVAANVLSATSNTLTVAAPSMATAHASDGAALDVVVSDLGTGASTTLSAALTYTGAPARLNQLRLVSAPAGIAYVGDPLATPFAVQLLTSDGSTPVPNTPITFTATTGSALFQGCVPPSCILLTDAHGIASTLVTPLTAGPATLQAAAGTLTQSASFDTLPQTGSLLVWSAPSGNQPVNIDAGSLGINDRLADGSPAAGRPITFSTLTGSVLFGGCSTSICTVTTNAVGDALLHVTPTSIGPITMQAADADITRTISFTSMPATDLMRVVDVPVASSFVDDNPGQFLVSLFLADGVTPDRYQTVTFTAPPGVLLFPCQSTVCPVSTGSAGLAGVGIGTSQAGTFTLQAAFGPVTQSASFTRHPHTQQLKIVSAPSGDLPVALTAPTLFKVQLLRDGVTPLPGVAVSLSGPQGAVALSACPPQETSCFMITDSNGMVSSTVTPLIPGLITLNVVYPPLVASASFTAVGLPETLTLLQQPGSTPIYVGDVVPFTAQVIAPGGSRPLQYSYVTFAITAGSFGFTDWYAASATRQTDQNGLVSEYGVAGGPGPVTLVIGNDVDTKTVTFNVLARTDRMKLLSAPSSGTVGTPAAAPFSVQALLSDGVTPAAGRAVTLSATQGSATFSACPSPPSCQLVADSRGIVSSIVIPRAPGAVTLTATEGGVQLSASFNVAGLPAPDRLTLVSAPSPALLSGASSPAPFAVKVTLADGTTPVAGIPITFSESSPDHAAAAFPACASSPCVIPSDAGGIASTPVTAGAPGTLTLLATAALPTGLQTVSVPLQVIANQWSIASATPDLYLLEGTSLAVNLQASALENGLPAASQPVHWTHTGGIVPLASDTLTDALGATLNPAFAGPLSAGTAASSSACLQSSLCAVFHVSGVATSQLQVVITSGAQQSAIASPLLPVVATVQDSAGHPVASAPVSIFQTVTPFTSCPDRGRCPAAPILSSQATVALTGADGTVTIQPLTLPGTPTQTQLALSAGTQGFASTLLTLQP